MPYPCTSRGHTRMAPTSDPAETTPSSARDDTNAAVFAEQVRLLYRLSRPAYGGSLAVALILMLGLWNVLPGAPLAGWFMVVAAITGVRYFLYQRYTAYESMHAAQYWATRFVAGAVAMGGMWGVLGSLLLPGEFGYQLLIVFVVAGMVVSGLMVLTL